LSIEGGELVSTRTVLDFGIQGDPWPTIDSWAQQSGYRLKEGSEPNRLYEKSIGIMVPMMLQIQQAGDQLHLEAWVRATRLTQIFSLFLNPAEVGIESGGDIHYRIPRGIARDDVNKLLNSLGRPPIA
jgi:hypothetical protein